jgi:uncharacterized membrane protein YraQ (UPF0718 family)
MKKLLKRYRFFLLTLVLFGGFWLAVPALGIKALGITGYSLKEMLLVIPPIFVLMGLLDVWVPRETMVRYMGERSGLKGAAVAFFIGSAAAGPLYGAFPVAAVLLKKGASLFNVLVFLGAWSTTKIPMFLFEYSALGPRFAVTRLLVDIPGIVLIAWILKACTTQKEREEVVARAAGRD